MVVILWGLPERGYNRLGICSHVKSEFLVSMLGELGERSKTKDTILLMKTDFH